MASQAIANLPGAEKSMILNDATWSSLGEKALAAIGGTDQALRIVAQTSGEVAHVTLSILLGMIFALYLLLDHPEKSAWQCLRESAAVMRGHKWELFVLDLSFLGWMLLSALFAPVSIWLDPYRAITNANYYNRLVGAQGGPRIYEGSFTDIPNDPQS